MTAIKASDVDRFIAKPDPAQPIVLVFGPDAGLVRERVDALVRASVDDPNDPFTLARIEGDELAGNPSRLVEEALMVEPTETETKETLDGFAEAIAEILREAAEDPDIALQAPYTTPVRRLDEVGAAKHPVILQAL